MSLKMAWRPSLLQALPAHAPPPSPLPACLLNQQPHTTSSLRPHCRPSPPPSLSRLTPAQHSSHAPLLSLLHSPSSRAAEQTLKTKSTGGLSPAAAAAAAAASHPTGLTAARGVQRRAGGRRHGEGGRTVAEEETRTEQERSSEVKLRGRQDSSRGRQDSSRGRQDGSRGRQDGSRRGVIQLSKRVSRGLIDFSQLPQPSLSQLPQPSLSQLPQPSLSQLPQPSFSSLPLSSTLVARLLALGLESPTQIQAAAIPALLNGHDATIQSFTGSGKTLAFLLPILSSIGPLSFDRNDEGHNNEGRNDEGHNNEGRNDEGRGREGRKGEGGREVAGGAGAGAVLAVVVAPSRELAMQILKEAERIFGESHKRLVQQLIGGANPSRQIEALKKNKPLLVVGTPGRIAQMSRAGKLHTHGCRFLVLDEADELLSHKFRVDMMRILDHVGQRKGLRSASSLPSTRGSRQTVLVSATMPPAVISAAQKWGYNPQQITAATGASFQEPAAAAEQQLQLDMRDGMERLQRSTAVDSLSPSIAHYFVISPKRHRVDILRRCIHALNAQSVIVFMNFQQRLQDTQFKLEARGIAAASLHGGMTKVARANVLKAFRDGGYRVLVTSEVGGRGIDVPNCDLVVNLELPTDELHYAHRAGRTGRLGRQGIVVSVCEEREQFILEKMQRKLSTPIAKAELVGGIFSAVVDESKG